MTAHDKSGCREASQYEATRESPTISQKIQRSLAEKAAVLGQKNLTLEGSISPTHSHIC